MITRRTALACALVLGMHCAVQIHNARADAFVDFTWPANNQDLVALSGLRGTAQPGTGTIQRVVFSIYDQSLAQWWNGAHYQAAPTNLPAQVSGTNWVPAPGVLLPALCCAQTYQLDAMVTDSATNTASTNITVLAESSPPIIAFSPLADGQVVANLSAMGGSVTDPLVPIASVVFSIQELDINGGSGRWWDGSRFQAAPIDLPATVSAGNWSRAPGVALPALNSGQPYLLTATAVDTLSNSASASITVTNAMTVLTWDPGQTALGTMVLQKPNTNGGNYWFQINPQSPSHGVWRTALNVLTGQAGVFMGRGSPPSTNGGFAFASANVGSNGFVVDSSQFNPGETWYILVNASSNAQWNLVTGDAFIYTLGVLAADASSGTNAPIGAEGMIFFQTTISSDTLAWRLWLGGAANSMYVKKSSAPDPVSYDLIQTGQMLVVPPYLAGDTFNGTYFVGVSGNPGTPIHLDSRQHAVTNLPFGSLTNIVVAANDFPYRTFRVQVPVQQIAWQLNLGPSSGRPNIAVRRDLVPNEFRNDAFSETPSNVGASVTLVPPPPQSGAGVPGLSDGTFFVTIYSTASFGCAFTNANPVITDVHYIFNITNDAPNRAGWRFYRVPNIAEQLGSLGWGLLLSNQAPGTEIALRRNAVPGRWNQRTTDDNYFVTRQGYVDYSGTGGILQRPGHQADIWYIGVYTPDQALGKFSLTGNLLTGQPIPFDGAGSSVSIANQAPGIWQFFRVNVPSEALGWDIRLVGVSDGNPQMVVSRDTLPTALNTSVGWIPGYWYPQGATNWLSGLQWLGDQPWNGCGGGRMLAMGVGNPLEAGTYFIGVQDPDNASSYTLQSRGIGTNDTIRVRELSFNGSTNNPGLAVAEGDYYRVVVPSNAPDWKLQLQATVGDVVLKVQKDYLPNNGPIYPSGNYYDNYYYNAGTYGSVVSGQGGQLMMKAGDEQWTLLPPFGQSNVTAGTYYVLVAAQGENLANNCVGPGSGLGSGNASYILSSRIEPLTLLADALSYGNDLVLTNAQAGGEIKFYQFNVPAGIASIEVRLEDRVGNPVMYLNQGLELVGTTVNGYSPSEPYGNYGGTNYQWKNGTLITAVNPNGPYHLSVYASLTNGGYADSSYTLRVRAVPPPLVTFDGGTFAVTDQAAGTWQFFRVNVPAEALGWDIRLVGVSDGNPQMVVSRDTLPTALNTSVGWIPGYWYPQGATNWLSGLQWLGDRPWNGCGDGRMLAMGMGNPLEAGTYFIGVQDPDNASSYTLQSRGIGTNALIPVRNLSFNGSTNNPGLAVAEGDYYRVVVPSNAPDWKLQLQATVGDVVLKVQKDYLPNNGPIYASGNYYDNYYYNAGTYGSVVSGQGGQLMMKAGDEQWTLLPPFGQSNMAAGTYYVLVAAQGESLANNCIGPGSGLGTGSAGYTLSSRSEPVTLLPDALSYGNDLVFTNAQAGGEMKFYHFNVPAGIASIEVRLEDRVGNPVMYLNQGVELVGTTVNGYIPSEPYGNYGGTNHQWNNGTLITAVNPNGPYSLSVYPSLTNGGYADSSYVLRVRAVPPPLVTFDGGTFAVTDQAAGTWQFFRVNVPSDATGWDIRLVGVSDGNPQMVVSRDTLPTALNTSVGWVPGYWYPQGATNWLSGLQWLSGPAWNGCGNGRMLAMGMGNPLEAGTYFIGVQDPDNASSYILQSRGIGTNDTIRVRELSFNGSTNNPGLAVAEGDYYRVVVPSNAPDWKLQLQATVGDVVLKVQKDYLPNNGPIYASGIYYDNYYYNVGTYGSVVSGQGGQLMMKAGDEQWTLLPPFGQSNVAAGTYYVLVAAQGENLANNCIGPGSGLGTGNASYTLSSRIESVTLLPDVLSYGNDLVFTNAQAAGEMKFYQFNVPAGIASIEVRLEDRVGNPVMYLNQGVELVGTTANGYNPSDPYGSYGGTNYQWRDGNLITIPNPQPGFYSLSLYSSVQDSGGYPDASYVIRVGVPAIPRLSFSSELNGVAQTNTISGLLADNQRAFYQVTVPGLIAGAPVLGWKLDLAALNGSPSLRVRHGPLLPGDTCDTTTFASDGITIAAPYLTPGTWYVEVKGGGSTEFSLTSSAIATNNLSRPPWVMPALGQTNLVPGLTLPMFGDTGIDDAGNPLPGDQGIDLAHGHFDFYTVVVPTNNAGLLRTVLQAISGNPNLYLRVGAAPTLNHYAQGSCDPYDGQLIDRRLSGSATEYANWVPLNGRYEAVLRSGIWVLAVQAGGNANVRYRLQVSCGNPATNGLVQDLALNGGAFTNQNLNGGDWRYYRVQIPSNAPANWAVAFSRSLGSARMFVRDTSPPGDGNVTADFSDPNNNPSPWHDWQTQDLENWAGDGKNQGPYPRFDAPGTYVLSTPPLRPGSVYYLGFWSPSDTTFSVSSSTNGGAVVVSNTIAFYGGSIAASLPAHGSLLYRMEVPPGATRLMFSGSNSTNVVLSLEQGTIALAGGPAHWTSYLYNNSQNSNQANASFDHLLTMANDWPWLPGYTYYLTLTNTAASPENLGLTMSLPSDLRPLAFLAPTLVTSTQAMPVIQVVWGVTNHGAAPAVGVWYDRVWFSTNGTLDAQSISRGDFPFYGTLAPGGTYWQTNMVTLPMSDSGSYTLFVQVDVSDAIYEISLADKVSAPVSGIFTLSPPPPVFQTVTSAHGSFIFTWSAQMGQTYQVQYKTNLDQPNWMNLGSALPATNGTMTLSDPMGPNAQRFYRVILP